MSTAGEIITGTLAANGGGTPFQPIPNKPFNAYLTGAFSGTMTLQRSPDQGANWYTCSKPDLTDAAFTGACNMIIEEPTAGTLYRWLMSSYATGSAGYRFDT